MNNGLKSFCCAAFLALSGAYVHAQSLQLKAGLNLCTSQTKLEPGLRMGFYAGIAKDIRLFGHITFQPGMMYSRQVIETGLSRYGAHCFQMPLYFNFEMRYKRRNLGILVGPQVGIIGSIKRVDSRADVRVPVLPGGFDAGLAISPYIISMDGRIRFELRYVASFVDRSDLVNSRAYNNVIQLGVSWLINKSQNE